MTGSFESFSLSPEMLEAIRKMGFTAPTEVQSKSIPLAMEGKDLLVQAKTGSGKTAAFGIPLLERIDTSQHATQALALAPTRELALQVKEELTRLGEPKRVSCVAVYGGDSLERQARLLARHPQVIVATPGRLLDFMQRRAVDFRSLRFLVLDEADKMLEMGFIEDVEQIVSRVPKERQTMFFSATLPQEVQNLSRQYMRQPVSVNVSMDKLTVEEIDQFYVLVKQNERISALISLLYSRGVSKALIFCRTKRTVDWLERELYKRRIPSAAFHGDFRQNKRTAILEQFKQGKMPLLLCTNVAARGLHIEDVSHVINFDFPQEKETYVHRIGRTARQGKRGEAITFCTNMLELQQLEELTKHTRSAINEIQLEEFQDPAGYASPGPGPRHHGHGHGHGRRR